MISLDWGGFLLLEMSRKGFLVASCRCLLGCRVCLAGSLRPWIVSWLVRWNFVPFFVQDVRLVSYQRDLGWLVFPWLEEEVFDAMGYFPNARSVPQTDKFHDLTKKKPPLVCFLPSSGARGK